MFKHIELHLLLESAKNKNPLILVFLVSFDISPYFVSLTLGYAARAYEFPFEPFVKFFFTS